MDNPKGLKAIGYLESVDTVIQDGATTLDYACGWYKNNDKNTNNDNDKNARPKIMLVGSSMGGAIALWLLNPCRVKMLLLE